MSENNEIKVPQLLAKCHRACRTGVLTLKRGGIEKRLYFDTGIIVYAISNASDEQAEEERIANQLMESPAEKVCAAYREYILRIIHNTFEWRDSTANFEYGQLPT